LLLVDNDLEISTCLETSDTQLKLCIQLFEVVNLATLSSARLFFAPLPTGHMVSGHKMTASDQTNLDGDLLAHSRLFKLRLLTKLAHALLLLVGLIISL
jgi:hypothetical protein